MVCGSYKMGDTGLAGDFRSGKRRGLVDGIDVIEFELSYSNKLALISRSWIFAKFALSSFAVAWRENYDIVFATSTPLTAALPGIFARLSRRKPFVFEVRDLWPELPKAMGVIRNPFVLFLLSRLEQLSYRFANRCIALSPGILEGVANKGVCRDKILMVPNGCDLSLFGAGGQKKWRPDGVAESDFMAVFAGTHGSANGLQAVLDAAEVLMQRQRRDIKFCLIGDGKHKEELRNFAERKRLSNVIFSSPVDKFKLAGLFAGADLGLQILANIPAFYYGTSPNKFFDYLSAGLPILTNYPGWIADLIEEHNCGIVVPAEDPVAFASALENAADGRDALRKKGINALHLAQASFDRAILAKQWASWVLGATKP